MLRAITLDYWDTVYNGALLPERKARHRAALSEMLQAVGHDLPLEELDALIRASAREAERWWRDEHRGYTTADWLRWLLAQLAIERPHDCEHIARAVEAVDATLVAHPPALLPGAAEGLRTLSRYFRLAIVSDTGFASGRAQNRILARDGLDGHFAATIYSMDIGHAKPRPEPFRAALGALGVRPEEALHVGDNERTDVGGALGVGMRAIRVDLVRSGGSSAAEYVATTFDDLVHYLLETARPGSSPLPPPPSSLTPTSTPPEIR